MASDPLKGARELDRKLAELGAVAGSKVMRQALRAAMKPVLEEARAAAPEGDELHRTYRGRLVAPGFAKRSLRLVVRRPGKDGTFRVVLGVRAEAFYALQFIELGFRNEPARPWLVPTFEREQGNALARFKDELSKRIEKAARAKR